MSRLWMSVRGFSGEPLVTKINYFSCIIQHIFEMMTAFFLTTSLYELSSYKGPESFHIALGSIFKPYRIPVAC